MTKDNQITHKHWDSYKEFIAAGSLVDMRIHSDFSAATFTVFYASAGSHERVEAEFDIKCSNCAYLAIRRLDYHESGGGIIYEAYLHEESTLINDLHENKLESIAGALALQYPKTLPVLHLQIIGEISIDALCEHIDIIQTKPITRIKI